MFVFLFFDCCLLKQNKNEQEKAIIPYPHLHSYVLHVLLSFLLPLLVFGL